MKNIFFYSHFQLLFINQQYVMSQIIINDFNYQSDLSYWVIVNDDVMGGISSCEMSINNDGNGIFDYQISTANNKIFHQSDLIC